MKSKNDYPSPPPDPLRIPPLDSHYTDIYSVDVFTKSNKSVSVSYTNRVTCGFGSFGEVVKCLLHEYDEPDKMILEVKPDEKEGGKLVAIKKTRLDARFKNRELSIMKLANHPNIIKLLYYFHEKVEEELEGVATESIYLNLILDYSPQTIYQASKTFIKQNLPMPELLISLYSFQLIRAVAYLHNILGICHRDLKPQNVLVDVETGIVKLCDFGSAKSLNSNAPNVCYTCSRYYRAPELIFGATNYTTAIDLWSLGCIISELLLGRVLFCGENGLDQLVEIIQVLGTPSSAQVQEMNRDYNKSTAFPLVDPLNLHEYFTLASDHAVNLVGSFLKYDPTTRITAIESLTHPFFNQIKLPNQILPTGLPIPSSLFNFSHLELSVRPDLIFGLIPKHWEHRLMKISKIDINDFHPVDYSRYQAKLY